MIEAATPEAIAGRMGEYGDAGQVRKNRIEVKTAPGRLRDAITTAQAVLGFDRLVTISTADTGESFTLLYHLIGPSRIILSLVVDLPRDQPAVPTVSDILPPAGIYERQIHDLFGILFEGHPGLGRIILNEDWPADEHPLRKDWKPGPGVWYGGVKVERRQTDA